jgi:hypothetical integral membrane protein (TIGR02206 family)
MAGLLSPLHIGMLAAIAALAVAAAVGARRRPGAWLPVARILLGLVLLLAEASWWVELIRDPSQVRAHGLPLEICDTNVLATTAALWWRRQLLLELSWFWGLTGAISSLLTPSPAAAFPDWLYFQYFIVHGGLVVAAALLVIGLRQAPRPGALVRVLVATALYGAMIALFDIVTGQNVLYLRGYPPGPPTLLNALGPWPWYLVSVAALTVALFALLDMPFRVRRRGAPDA